jgi:hypothetical protein
MIKKPLLSGLKTWCPILLELRREISQRIQVSAKGLPHWSRRTKDSFSGMMNKSQFTRFLLKLLDRWNHRLPLNP